MHQVGPFVQDPAGVAPAVLSSLASIVMLDGTQTNSQPLGIATQLGNEGPKGLVYIRK